MAKKKTWIRFRHKLIQNLGIPVIRPIARLKYGVRVEPFRAQGKRPYLVLYNHQTPYDQFFVGMAMKGPIYYMATEDIFSLGWISSLLRYLVAPIPIQKQTTDPSAVMTCLRVAREGGSIAIAPEGNRTYSGKTEYMRPGIARLGRKMGFPIALFRIEGGYGVEPRWSDKVRKGQMRAYVSRVLEPQDYANWSDTELMAQIEKELFVNEGCAQGPYRSERRAEYLERAIYVCPTCGLSRFESRGNDMTCTRCGLQVHYGEDKHLSGGPFPFVNDWYEYQKDFVNRLDVLQYLDEPMYREAVSIRQVLVHKKKRPLRSNAELCLYGDRLVIDGDWVLPFRELSAVTVLGRHKLNVYHGKEVYQFQGDKGFNALKYVQLYHRHKNMTGEKKDGKFLGL